MGTVVGTVVRSRRPWRFLTRLALSGLPLAFALGHVGGILQLPFLTRVEHYLYDTRVRATLQGGVDPRVVVVDIDNLSLSVEGRWPWPRDKLAHLVDQLFDTYGVRVVGFDVVFAEPEEPSAVRLIDSLANEPGLSMETRAALGRQRVEFETDKRFADALIARDVVLGYVFKPMLQPGEAPATGALPQPLADIGGDLAAVPWPAAVGYTGNLAILQQQASFGGFFDTPLVDEDGIVRRAPLVESYARALYPSLALAVADVAAGKPAMQFAFDRPGTAAARLIYLQFGSQRIPTSRAGDVLMPFRGAVGSFPYVSATAVLRGSARAEILKDAIVLVGASAPGLLDLRPTPVAKEYIGVEAHANLIAGLLDGAIRYGPDWDWIYETVVLMSLAIFTAFGLSRLAPLPALLAWLLVAAAVIGVNVGLWIRGGIVVPLATSLVYLAAAAALQLMYSYFVESRRKRRLSRLFGQYVPPELVEELDQSNAELTLEGETRTMTVLFSDVRGFTTISEGLAARELTQLMNEFLTPITEVIQENRGTIDKYMGDAVMAFWGSPLPDPDHARHAVHAALAMVERVARLREPFRARGWPEIHIGVGLSTGPMNVGNMGSRFRMAYTVLGDTVNLGSRLEGLTKAYGVNIIVSAETAAAVPEMLFRGLDLVRVKGKQEPVAIYEPVQWKSEAPESEAIEINDFSDILKLYRSQQWEAADKGLQNLIARASRPIYHLYRERIAAFRALPPPSGWDGAYTFDTK